MKPSPQLPQLSLAATLHPVTQHRHKINQGRRVNLKGPNSPLVKQVDTSQPSAPTTGTKSWESPSDQARPLPSKSKSPATFQTESHQAAPSLCRQLGGINSSLCPWISAVQREGIIMYVYIQYSSSIHFGCNSAQALDLAKLFSPVQSLKVPTSEGETLGKLTALFILLQTVVQSTTEVAPLLRHLTVKHG